MDFVKLGSLPKTVPGQLRPEVGSEFKSYKKKFSHDLSGPISAMAVDGSEQNERVLVATNTRVVLLSLGDSGFSELQQSSRHKDRVTCVAWRPDGKLFASGDGSGLVLVSSPSLGVLRRLQAHEGPVTALLFTQNKLFTAGRDGRVLCWDAATGQQSLAPFLGHTDAVTHLASSPTSLLLSSSLDGTLRVWDVETGKCEKIITHDSQIDSFALFADGLLAVLFGGSSARLVSLAATSTEAEATVGLSGLCHTRAVTGSGVFTGGDAFISTSADGTVKIRATRGLEVLHTWADFDGGVVGLGISGGKVFLADDSGKLVVRVPPMAPVGPAEQGALGMEVSKIHIVGKSGKHESHVDFLFRKFEFKKIAQMVVAPDSGLTHLAALAAVDELMQRNVLSVALRGLTLAEVAAVMDWATRALTAHPEHTGLVVRVVETTLDENPQVVRNPGLVQAMDKLRLRATQEVAVLGKIAPMVGTLQALMLA